MCIRDRDKDAWELYDVRADFSLTNDLAARDPKKLAELQACLLYTSDAADERSSVDLGGRRIIKKKKSGRNDNGAGVFMTTQLTPE